MGKAVANPWCPCTPDTIECLSKTWSTRVLETLGNLCQSCPWWTEVRVREGQS